MNSLLDELRKDCPMRHESGNCTSAGGFCTAVNDPICEALHNAHTNGFYYALETLQKKKDAWISVEDRLPDNKENHKRFLCRCILDGDNSERWALYLVLTWFTYDTDEKGNYYRPHFQDDGFNDMSVTHWMPLPAPPEKEGRT